MPHRPVSKRVLSLCRASTFRQALGQLCTSMDMKRQSVIQHLGLLEQANLISTHRRGREKLHFINPVPLYEVYARWIRKFEEGRLGLLHDLKQELERNEK
ncbi:helix-turn-helix transcriptional regulator [Phaeobacter sp. HF9A]|nr:helix-turn-helix transcriptional regulator [Phaeobacter sp. HF9A]